MSNMSSQTQTTSVLIVGAGTVGLSLAIYLAQAGVSVVVLDVKPKPCDAVWQERINRLDARVYALNLPSIALLKEIGVWTYIVRRADYRRMQVWQQDGAGEIVFGDGLQLMGSMVEPSVLDKALFDKAQSLPNLHLIFGAKLIDIDTYQGGHGVLVRISDATVRYQCQLLVGADGRSSQVRQLLGVGLDTLDYHQTAICCAIRTTHLHNHTARQAMLPTGTLALLPLAPFNNPSDEHWQSVVWTLPTKVANTYLTSIKTHQQTLTRLGDDIALYSGFALGAVEEVQSVASFALSAQLAKQSVGASWVLIGDASHGVHPLAGQGLNLGMADVIALKGLVALVSHSFCLNKPNTALAQYLRRYARERHAKTALMMHSFSAINWLFAGGLSDNHWLMLARSTGFGAVGKAPWLTHFFNKQAGGITP